MKGKHVIFSKRENEKQIDSLFYLTSLIIILIISVILIIKVKDSHPDFLRKIIPFIFAFIFVFLFMFLSEWKKGFFYEERTKIIIVLIITFFLILGVIQGFGKAVAVLDGYDYYYVDRTSFSEEVRRRENEDNKIRYIGTIGDYFFFLLPGGKSIHDDSIYIAVKDEIKPFILKRFKKHKNEQNENNQN